jgi:hypothetical protein
LPRSLVYFAAHDVGAGLGLERRRPERRGDLLGDVVDTARVTAQVEDAGDRRRLRLHDAGRQVRGREPHVDAVDVGEVAQRGGLVGDAVLDAHDRRARVGDRGQRAQRLLGAGALHREERGIAGSPVDLTGVADGRDAECLAVVG